MIRCPACGNEHRFYVTEAVRQRTLIETDGPYSYTVIQVAENLTVEGWEVIECSPCGECFDEEEGREEYISAHTDPDAPMTYTLVDASVS